MGSYIPLDTSTLFVVNAASLIVFTIVYLVEWSRESNPKYWLYLAIADLIFAVAFIVFSQCVDGDKESLLLPNCLIVVGLGFRWQAIRFFFGRRVSFLLPIILTVVVGNLLYFADAVGHGVVFVGVNIAIMIQTFIIINALVLERQIFLPSRWGLVASYGVVAASLAVRILQGLMLGNDVNSLLPGDVILDIHLLTSTFHIVAGGAFSLSMAYEHGANRLRQIALHDSLTGLLNRIGLESALIDVNKLTHYHCSVLVIDIDHFKKINDVYGHATGDQAIKRCGQLIDQQLRADDLAARTGGEEFVVVLPKTSRAEARRIAERIRTAIDREVVNAKRTVAVFTVSIGISYSEAEQLSISELIADADMHLYRAKSEGRNQVRTALGD